MSEPTVEPIIEHITALDDFQARVLEAGVPVVVDFWAEWCGPCKTLAPRFDRLASRYHPAVRFVKVDTELSGEIADRMGIRSLPTLMLFWRGEISRVMIGTQAEPALDKAVRKLRDRADGKGLVARLLSRRGAPGAGNP